MNVFQVLLVGHFLLRVRPHSPRQLLLHQNFHPNRIPHQKLLLQSSFRFTFFIFIPEASEEMRALDLELVHHEGPSVLCFLQSFLQASFDSSSWPL